MRKLATRRRRVVVGDDDPTLTAHAGLSLVAELDRVLDIEGVIDDRVGPIKARRQGLGAGGLVSSMAETMLAGGDFMCDLDVQRDDAAGRALRGVPDIPSSSTFIALAKGFDDRTFMGIEAANSQPPEVAPSRDSPVLAPMSTTRCSLLTGRRSRTTERQPSVASSHSERPLSLHVAARS